MIPRPLIAGFSCLALLGCTVNNANRTNSVTVAQTNLNVAPKPVVAPPRAPVELATAKGFAVTKTALAGERMKLASFAMLGNDCTADGQIVGRVVTAPIHGKVTLVDGTDFTNYAPGNTHAACNAKKTPALLAYYQSEPGYSGIDTTTLDIFYSNGNAPVATFNITVKSP